MAKKVKLLNTIIYLYILIYTSFSCYVGDVGKIEEKEFIKNKLYRKFFIMYVFHTSFIHELTLMWICDIMRIINIDVFFAEEKHDYISGLFESCTE